MPDLTEGEIAPSGEANRRGPIAPTVLKTALIAWAALMSYVIPRHEPWADEAQAWQLASNLDLRALFGHFLHYEGSPGLWHALLWLLVQLHISYTGMHWITASVALGGAALLLFRSPFPLPLRIALIFTYYLFYQYSVVARSYTLIAPLMFLLATIWPYRKERPLATAVLLALLANTAAHGLVISTGLVMVLAVEYRFRRNVAVQRTRQWLIAAALWLAAACFAAWCLLPPHDAEWPGGYRQALTVANFPALIASLPQPQHAWLRAVPKLQAVLGILLFFRGRLAGPIATNVHWGDAIWALLAIISWRQKEFRYMIPVLLMTVFTGVTRFSVYHGGLFWVLFLFLWWVTWPGDHSNRWSLALILVVCGAIVSQMADSVQAVRYDAAQPYSPDRDGAKVLRQYIDAGTRVDLAVPARTRVNPHDEFFAVGLEPYFEHEPLGNMRARFWIWTHDDEMRAAYLRDVVAHSTVILLEDLANDDRSKIEGAWLQQQGYRKARMVCGEVFYPGLKKSEHQLCHAFYEPK